MPGRHNYSSQGGWATGEGENGLPGSLTVDGRSDNEPPEYKATEQIEFLPGFESELGDVFEALITEGSSSGGGTNGFDGSDGGYRYGFNGKENDNEVKGEGNQHDYGMRIYDPRIGKFLSVDPLTKGYPELTPYQFASNTPIAAIDIDGEESGIPLNGIGPSGTPLSNYLVTAEGRKTWFKGMGIGIGVGGAILLDVYVTKGKITTTLLMSQGLGLAEHNRAKTPEGRAAQDQRLKENSLDFAKNLAGGYILNRLAKGMMVFTGKLAGGFKVKTESKNVNIYGEGESAGFVDVAVNPRFANGRKLSSEFASKSIDNIEINNSPIFEAEAKEIVRLAKPGATVKFSAPVEGNPSFKTLEQQLKGKADVVSETTEVFEKGTEFQYTQKTITYKIK